MLQIIGGKGGEALLGNRRAHLAHQIEQEMDVVHREQDVAEDFIRFNQMTDIGAAEVLATFTATGWVNRSFIPFVLFVFHVEATAQDEGAAVARQARGQHAVKDVDAAHDAVDEVFWGANAHQVAGLVLWHDGVHPVEHLIHFRFCLANGKAADCVAGQIERGEKFGRFFPQITKLTTLHNAKERLVITRFRIDTAQRPGMRALIERVAHIVVIVWVGAFIKHHDDVCAKILLDFDAFFRRETVL